MLSPDNIRAQLLKLPGLNMDEVYHVTTFRCYRRTKAGDTQLVIVEILDMGPQHPLVRYHCVALTEDGRFATGNPADSIDVALAIVHWAILRSHQRTAVNGRTGGAEREISMSLGVPYRPAVP